MMCDTTLAQVLVRVIPSMCHAPEWLFVLSSFLTLFSSVCFSYIFFFCLNLDFLPLPLPRGLHRSKIPCAIRQMRSSCPFANNAPLTGYEAKLFDDFHYSETSEIFLQEQSSDTMPSYLHDAELSVETIGRALFSPLSTQEREEPAGRRQACHSLEESCQVSRCLSVM